MLILLVLCSQAAGEWVEISQQHYRKPLRSNFPLAITEILEDTSPGNMYNNITLSHSWNKGSVNKTPKHGSVQRVHPNINSVKAPHVQGAINHGLRHNHEQTEDYENADQIYFKNVFQTSSESNFDSSDEIDEKSKLFFSERPFVTQSFDTKSYGYGDTEIATDKTSAIRSKYRLQTNRKEPAFVIEKTNAYNENPNDGTEQISTEYATNGAIDMLTTPKRVYDDGNKYSPAKNVPVRDKNKYTPKKTNENHKQSFINKDEEQVDSLSEDSDADINIEKHKEHEEDPNNTETNENHTMENLFKFLKLVSHTIKKNTHGSVSSKTRYLQNLKDSILANIENRIESLWPEDRRGRRRRAARGHLEIPSSESALMSISFLTFAVFLIKLVLQLIQTYKNKSMMVAPTVVAAVGRAAAATATGQYQP